MQMPGKLNKNTNKKEKTESPNKCPTSYDLFELELFFHTITQLLKLYIESILK